MKFRTTVRQSGANTTGIHVPDDVVDALGGGRRPKVTVTLNGYTYRSSIATMGGRFMVGVSASVRAASGVSGGDTLDVDIALDHEPRQVVVPADLRAALGEEPGLMAYLDSLSYSKQRRVVEQIEAAKAPETRQRRIDKARDQLRRREL